MGCTLKLDLTEEVYALLKKISDRAGQMPEDLAAYWVISETMKHVDDPLEKFIGMIKTDKSDWAEKHDIYLGEILNKSMEAQ